jgi:cytidine deaminase
MEVILTDDKRRKLIELAGQARENAYVPYSNYKVGAALLTKKGTYFTGCNVENAAYPDSLCAERVAVVKAVSEGECEFEAIAVVTSNGGMPCGSCRQVLAEFGLDIVVIVADTQARISQETTLSKLLPGAFTPESLKRT